MDNKPIDRRSFLRFSGATALSFSMFGLSSCGIFNEGKSSKKPPNVILVITDDQGYGDLGCHGNNLIKTPKLDRLYAQSVRLTDFHVSSVCAPTRGVLMTGRYSNRVGVWETYIGRSFLRSDETTLGDIFLANGYRTGFFGKWHLGDNYPYLPKDRGFEHVLRHGAGGIMQTPDYWGNDYFDDTYFLNGKAEKYEGYCTDVWFENAIEFIEKNKDKPFFCYLSTNAPHGPYVVPEKYSKMYKDIQEVPNPYFYGMVTNIDDNVGELEKKLEQLNLKDNTVFIFMTDNGTAAGFKNGKGFNASMRGTKGSEYDGGHRVPFFIRWPNGKIGGGKDIQEITAHIDILPTLIDLCGFQKPQNIQFDGKSLKPLLYENNSSWLDRVIITDCQRVHDPIKWRKSSVMTDRWRLVNGKELYDIKTDPGQKNDLADKNPEVVRGLRKEYEDWWTSVSQRFDEYCRIPLGTEKGQMICLTGHDWHPMGAEEPVWEHVPWNQASIRRGVEGNGFWAVEVAKEGRYEFQLRRWPIEIDKPLGSSLPAGQVVPGGFQYPKGKAINITSARLKIADFDETISVSSNTTAAIFKVNLKTGKTKLQTWFFDDSGRSRGSYYAYAKRHN